MSPVIGQRAVGAPALGVHDALGNALAVLVRELLEQLVVLQQQRARAAPAVSEFWLSATGAPAVVVRVFLPVLSCVMGAGSEVLAWAPRELCGSCEVK